MASEVELERMLVRLVGDGSSYMKMMEDSVRSTRAATQQISQQSAQLQQITGHINGLANSVQGYGRMFLGMAGLGSMFGTLSKSISLAGAAEENEVAFGTMLKSAEAGKKMVKDLQDFAAATPLDTNTLQNASKMLLQFGVEGKNILPILKLLGNATGGNSEKLMQMSLAFGQMSSTGRLMGQDLLQMINAGFNPLEELAKTSGKSMEYWKGEMEKGRVTMHQVVGAFQSASAAGGRFEGLMEKQSKTLRGLFSTMQDDIDGALREIGRDLVENLNLKGFIQDVSRVAQTFTNWFKSISPQAKMAAAAVIGIAVAFGALTIAIALAGKVLNIAFGGIPLITGLIITGIASLVGYISYMMVKNKGLANTWDDIKSAASSAWDWITRKAQQFWNYIQPTLTYLKELAISTWEVVKRNGILAWEWIQNAADVAWVWIREKSIQFINWITPIWRAWSSAVVKMWDYIGKNAVMIWDWVEAKSTWVWDKIQNGVNKVALAVVGLFSPLGLFVSTVDQLNISWSDVQNVILTTFIMAEFAMDNFSTIFGVITDYLAYRIVKFGNDFIYVFTELLPAAIMWLNREWRNIFVDIFNFTTTVFANLATNIGELVKNIPKLLKGEMKFSDLWSGLDKELTKGFQSRTNKFVMPKREIGEIERLLKEEYEKNAHALGVSYEEFKRKKMEEYKSAGGAVDPESVVPSDEAAVVTDKAAELGLDLGKAVTKGAKSELSKFDAVLSTSAEAISRLADFQERMESTRNPQANSANTTGAGAFSSSAFEATKTYGAEAATRKDANTTILKEIRDTLKDNKNTTTISAANLEG